MPLEDIRPKIYTITEITLQIKRQLETNFSNIWIEGEVSNLSLPASGHIYFTLKDEQSQLRAVIFKNRRLKFQIKDGMKLIVKGGLSVYDRRGEYQLIGEYAEPSGIGALQLAFEQLKQRLEAEGLFDRVHKKPIPLLPQKIGVVTSPTGAVIRDILNIIDRRFPNVHILINPVRVQGDGAAQEIAQAIGEFNRREEMDVVILARGGGSLEDLWSFNEEIVARAIYDSKIPIISAVGHEIDFTIADFVADLRAPTPSAAAELVVQNKAALTDKLNSTGIRLQQGVRRTLDAYLNRLRLLSQNRFLADPYRAITDKQQRVDDLGNQLKKNIYSYLQQANLHLKYVNQGLNANSPFQRLCQSKMNLTKLQEKLYLVEQHLLQNKRGDLALQAGRLDALSPLNILSRGYSICQKLPDMEIITDIQEVAVEDEVSVKLSKGLLICKVNRKYE